MRIRELTGAALPELIFSQRTQALPGHRKCHEVEIQGVSELVTGDLVLAFGSREGLPKEAIVKLNFEGYSSYQVNYRG